MNLYLRLTGWLILLLILATIPFFILSQAEKRQPPPAASAELPFPSPDIPPPPPAEAEIPTRTLADDIVTDTTSPQERLVQFHHLASNVLLLNKGTDTRHYATNEDLTQLLLGKNINRQPYLGRNSSLVNGDGQLIDLFGQPIIVHVESQDRFTLRSAGPDQTPYTEDDQTWPPPKQTPKEPTN